MRMRNLGRTNGMHNEQRRPGLCANPGIAVILQGAEVVEQVSAGCQRIGSDFRPPGVDGKQRREDLASVPRLQVVPHDGESLEERTQAAQLLFGRYCGAIRARAFSANIDDIRSLGDMLPRLLQGPKVVNPPVATERIVIDIDDTHDHRAARKSNASIAGKQFHLVLGRILFQGWYLLQQP